MPGHTPRFTGSFWVGHGSLMARMANFLWAGNVAAAAALVSDNPADFAELSTAFKLALNNAGYNDDGSPSTQVDPAVPFAPFHREFTAKPVESWSERFNGPCRVSVGVPDGKQVWIGYSANPGQYIEGQAGAANGGYEVHLPVGTWWVNVKLSDTMQAANAKVDGFPVT